MFTSKGNRVTFTHLTPSSGNFEDYFKAPSFSKYGPKSHDITQ